MVDHILADVRSALGAVLLSTVLLCSMACSQEPAFETWTPVVPDEPPERAASIAGEWHWIHPYPTPYSLRKLQPVDGGVLASGHLEYLEGGYRGNLWEPVTLRQTFSVTPVPVRGPQSGGAPDENPFTTKFWDLTPTKDGWLGLADSGVYEFGPDGLIDSRTIPATARPPTRISGRSADTFVAMRDRFEGGFVYRDGEGTRYNDLRNDSTQTRTIQMWPNGQIWEVASGEPPGRWMVDEWRGFPTPSSNRPNYLSAIGPGPATGCPEVGIWAASSKEVYRWEDETRQWARSEYDGPRVTSIGCDHEGNVLITDEEGGFSRRIDGSWTRTRVDDRALRSAAPAGTDDPSKTYIGGDDGMLAELADGNVKKLTGGFRLPEKRETGFSSYRRSFTDVWMNADGSRGVLLHESGFYHGSGDHWVSRPHEPIVHSVDREWDEVWGINKPRFAILDLQLRRWDGSRWVPTELGQTDVYRNPARDIAGTSANDVWFARTQALYRYNGSSWRTILKDGSLSLSALYVDDDGTVLAGNRGSIHEVQRRDGEWQLTEITDPRCGVLRDIHRDDEGTLWVAGKSNCIARQTDSGWHKYEFNLIDDPDKRGNGSTEFIRQPGDQPPLIATEGGVVEPTGEGTLRTIITGQFTGGAYLPKTDVNLLLHQHGVLARYPE